MFPFRATAQHIPQRRAWQKIAWVLRALVLLALLSRIAPAHPLVFLGPPQTVSTQHPAVCVHTLLTNEVEEWKIQRTLQLVREMGAPTIVEFFPWAYVERAPGQYDWAHTDRIIRHAQNQGLRVIARLGLVPDWARPPVQERVTTLTYLDEKHFADFAAFVGAFTARYTGTVVGVIIWNEPNLSLEWGGRAPDPAAYVELLRLAYAAAHAANPQIVVYGGALAPTLEPEGSGAAMNDLRYLERMYQLGARPYFDALAVHAYGFTAPPDDPPAADKLNFRRVELLRALMVRYDDAAKPLSITEGGWSDDARWVYGVRPAQRMAYTLRAFELVEAWPWAERLCLWNFRQPQDRFNRRDAYFALVSSEFDRKPIYEAVQAYAQGQPYP